MRGGILCCRQEPAIVGTIATVTRERVVVESYIYCCRVCLSRHARPYAWRQLAEDAVIQDVNRVIPTPRRRWS